MHIFYLYRFKETLMSTVDPCEKFLSPAHFLRHMHCKLAIVLHPIPNRPLTYASPTYDPKTRPRSINGPLYGTTIQLSRAKTLKIEIKTQSPENPAAAWRHTDERLGKNVLEAELDELKRLPSGKCFSSSLPSFHTLPLMMTHRYSSYRHEKEVIIRRKSQ